MRKGTTGAWAAGRPPHAALQNNQHPPPPGQGKGREGDERNNKN